VIVAAVVIASAIEPIVRRLKRRKIHRIASVIVIYILLALILAAILIFFMPLVVGDATNFLATLPKTISFQELWSPISNIGLNFGSSYSFGEHVLSLSDVISQLRALVVGNSDSLLQTAGAIFGGLLSFILIVVLSFYLAVKEEGVDDFLRIVAPVKHHDYIIDLWKRSQRKIALWLQGQIMLGIVVGVLVYILLVSVGIDHALLFALLAAILEIIPIFGPIISSIPPILLAFSDRGLGIGLLLVGLYLIIYQLESQVFYPLVVRKIVGISPIVVILALVIGAKLAGILGALIAVPLSGALMEYINDIEKYKNAERAERAVLEKAGKV
jgi:predicted PurR-regulated permease PerM